MKPKSVPKYIPATGILNEVYWLSCEAKLLSGVSFFFREDQTELIRPFWGKKVTCLLNAETRYLRNIEQAVVNDGTQT
jgi:hypothetical protein